MIVAEIPRAALCAAKPAPLAVYSFVGTVERMALLHAMLALVDATMAVERISLPFFDLDTPDLFPMRMRARREIASIRESLARDCSPWFEVAR